MGKQYNKVEKRQRRDAYIKRRKSTVNAAKAKTQAKAEPTEPPVAPAPAPDAAPAPA